MTKSKKSRISKSGILSHPYKIIFLVCILLYAQILAFGLVYFDDHGFVLLAANTLKLSNIPEFFRHSVFWVMGDTGQQYDVFYRPLQNVLYALCNTLAREQAWVYHFAGLLLHIGVCFTLFAFLKELKYHASLALIFTLIYCVHPVLTQSVAWIAGAGDQMAALFALLAFIYFIRFYRDEKKKTKNIFLHFAFLTCALFSKEISIAIILLCPAYLFLFEKGRRIPLLLKAGAGWGVILIVYFIFRNNALTPVKTDTIASLTGSVKVNGLLVLEYIEKIFLPYRLSPIPSRSDAEMLTGGIILAVLVLLFIIRKKITLPAVFGALWFSAFLFPTFIQQNPQAHFFAFEHRLYLPLIGILILLIELAGIKQFNFRSPVHKYGFGAVLPVLFALAFSHSKTFSNPYTFYDKALSSSPQSVIAYNGYSKLLLKDEKYAEAIEALKKSFLYEPTDIQTSGKIAEIYLKNLNNPQEAIAWFRKTLEVDSTSVEAAVSIGDAYFNFLRDTSNAIFWYKHSLKINPRNEFALANLGIIYAGKGQNTQAKEFLLKALAINPAYLPALKWIAIIYFNEGKITDALRYLSKGFEDNPHDADLQRNLMICHYKLNDYANTKRFAELYSSHNSVPAEIENYLKKGN